MYQQVDLQKQATESTEPHSIPNKAIEIHPPFNSKGSQP
jgi:hypothetical protein